MMAWMIFPVRGTADTDSSGTSVVGVSRIANTSTQLPITENKKRKKIEIVITLQPIKAISDIQRRWNRNRRYDAAAWSQPE